MPSLTQLDDLAYDLILSHLRYIDIFNLSCCSKALRSIVEQSSLQTLNYTKFEEFPICKLPYASSHHLYDPSAWRALKHRNGTKRASVYLSRLFFTSRHRHELNTLSLRDVILDGTFINVLDIIHFVSSAWHLRYLSVRFCTQVNRLLLQNYLDSLTEHRHEVRLQRLDVIGIEGLSFFEPQNNGIFTLHELTAVELMGAGPEYDYTDRWREEMYDFKMSLERVPTSHGRKVVTDIARCSQSYCRNFNLGRKELADPTTRQTLPPCFLCRELYALPLCRPCISARSCKICDTFICPKCYDIDTYFELADFTSHQGWLQALAHDTGPLQRNCRTDMSLGLGPKACLTIQQVHRHLEGRATAERTLSEGFI